MVSKLRDANASVMESRAPVVDGLPAARREIVAATSVSAPPRRHDTGSPARTRPATGRAARASPRPAATQSKMAPHSAVKASFARPPRSAQPAYPEPEMTTARVPRSVRAAMAATGSPRLPNRAVSTGSTVPIDALAFAPVAGPANVIGGRESNGNATSADMSGDAGAPATYHSAVRVSSPARATRVGGAGTHRSAPPPK